MITDSELAAVMPRLTRAKRERYLPLLQAAATEFGITSYRREAAFLAQLAHESAELRYFEEIASGKAYEGRRDLGNTQAGDGPRYKGRGPIQLTGRANYRAFGRKLGLDLAGQPTLAATPEVGFRIAGLYWRDRGLNELADAGDFRAITKRINGGYRGWDDRLRYYQRALAVLSRGDDPATEQPAAVTVNGAPVADAEAFWKDGLVWAWLRPIAKAAGWRVLDASGTVALVQDAQTAVHRVPLVNRGGRGFVLVADLPGTVTWDDDTRTACIVT